MRYFFSLLLFTVFYSSSYGQDANRPGSNGISFTYVMRAGCDGDTVIFSNTSHQQAGTNGISWDFGDGSATDNTNASPVHIYRRNEGSHGKYVATLSYTSVSDPNVKLSYSMPVTAIHPLSARIATDESSVCWLVPMSFVAAPNAAGISYTWNMGDGSKQAGNEIDYTYANPGDYTVRLTVSDAKGCVKEATENVHVVKVTAFTATHDTSVCLKDSMSLQAYAVTEPSMDYHLEWTPAEHIGSTGAPTASFFGVGDFVYTVTASTFYPACNATDTVAIHSFPTVTLVNVTPNQTISQGASVQLNATGATYYVWKPANGVLNDPNISNPVATPADPVTKFTVYGMNDYGCLDSSSVTITTTGAHDGMPSAFTPNGDGLNDVFNLANLTFQKLIDFKIFNRNGKLVFHTSNPDMGWDGTWNGAPQEMGVYTYQVIVTQMDGSIKTYKGNVTLIR